MADNKNENLALRSRAIDQVIEVNPEDDTELQTMAKALVTQRLTNLKNRGLTEVQQLKDRQQRIRLMHSMLRAINESSDENGVDFKKNAEFEKLREKAKELMQAGNALVAEADRLEKEGRKAEAKALREEGSEMQEVAQVLGAESSKEIYSKDEKDKLVENLRMTCEDLNTVNQLQTQTVSRLNNELHESLLIGRDIMKRVHEILSAMARGIRGG